MDATVRLIAQKIAWFLAEDEYALRNILLVHKHSFQIFEWNYIYRVSSNGFYVEY